MGRFPTTAVESIEVRQAPSNRKPTGAAQLVAQQLNLDGLRVPALGELAGCRASTAAQPFPCR